MPQKITKQFEAMKIIQVRLYFQLEKISPTNLYEYIYNKKYRTHRFVYVAIKKLTIARVRLSKKTEFKNFPVAFHERLKEGRYIFSRLPRDTAISPSWRD